MVDQLLYGVLWSDQIYVKVILQNREVRLDTVLSVLQEDGSQNHLM